MTKPLDLTKALEEAVYNRLVAKGYVLVVKQEYDPCLFQTTLTLSNGRQVHVTDEDAAAGPPTIYADACQAAGALVEDDLDHLIALALEEGGPPSGHDEQSGPT